MIFQETDDEMRARWARENKELRALLAKQRAEALAEKAAKAKTPTAAKTAEAAAARAAELAARAAEVAATPIIDKRKKAVIRGDGRRFECVRDAGRLYGDGGAAQIGNCCRGKQAKAYGFTWSYAEPEPNNG
jgi:hypothetical protein